MISRKSDPFSEKGMRATVQQMLLILPESPLEKGGEWRHSLELNQPKEGGSRKVEVRYRYVGPARYKGSTVEKIVSRATFDGGKVSAGGALANVVAELNSGVVYFDNTAGRLVEEEDTQKRTVEYTKSGRTAREEVKIVSRVEIRDRIRNGDGHGGDRVQTDASPKPQR
jgi:hypothetical protein